MERLQQELALVEAEDILIQAEYKKEQSKQHLQEEQERNRAQEAQPGNINRPLGSVNPQYSVDNIRPIEPKVEKPNTYMGKNSQELFEFKRSCNIAFRNAPNTYNTDAKKVLHEHEHGVDSTTWNEFTTYLENLISDPANRELDKIQQYLDAKQKKGQTIQQFLAYIDRLESELVYPYSDTVRLGHLLAKLLPEIRKKIMMLGTLPESRTELITVALRIEAQIFPKEGKKSTNEKEDKAKDYSKINRKRKHTGFNRNSYPPATGANASETGKKKGSSNKYGGKPNISPEERERRKKENACYSCGKTGHRAADCLSKPGKGQAQ
ncbi:MAG: hypothetical protein M1829_006917 [Trizodia sp. TS-e1964]|nr:MAG: hypothetical protein M1829_006917 [Trizodia sp. TS-e1964]